MIANVTGAEDVVNAVRISFLSKILFLSDHEQDDNVKTAFDHINSS